MEPFVSAQMPQISYLAKKCGRRPDAINTASSLDDLWESSIRTGEAANETRTSAFGLPSSLIRVTLSLFNLHSFRFFHVYSYFANAKTYQILRLS